MKDSKQIKERISGKWQSENGGITITFYPDGTGSKEYIFGKGGAGNFFYKIEGKQIFFSRKGEIISKASADSFEEILSIEQNEIKLQRLEIDNSRTTWKLLRMDLE
jgi:hypothetical protein